MRLWTLAPGVLLSALAGCHSAGPAADQASDALASLGGPADGWTTCTYEGSMTVEGHYHRPHERQTVPVRLVVTADPAQPGASAEWSSWWQERSQPPSVRTLVESSGDVLQRDAAQPRWTTQSLEDQKWSLALLRLLDARQVLTGAAQATNAEPRNPAARDPLRPRLEFDGPRLA